MTVAVGLSGPSCAIQFLSDDLTFPLRASTSDLLGRQAYSRISCISSFPGIAVR